MMGAGAIFGLALGWTWGWNAVAVGTGQSLDEAVGAILFMIAQAGPLVAVAVALSRAPGAYRRDLARRVFSPRGLTWTWWLVIVAVALLPRALALVVAAIAGVEFEPREEALTLAAAVGIVGFAFVAGAAEEPCWRGVATDALRPRRSVTTAALVVGAAWIAWHLPLYFFEGTFQYAQGFGSASFWTLSLELLPLSVLYARVQEHTGSSILAPILMHAGRNAANELLPVSIEVRVVDLALLAAAALVAMRWGGRRAAPQPARDHADRRS